MAATGKQIEGVTGETHVTELARAAISQRLAVVVENLSLAAEGKTEERERVHQLRVSTRRAVAALRLFDEYCPPKRTRKLLKLLKRIRRTAGAARDLDVFTDRLFKTFGEVHLLLAPDLAPKREKAQREIIGLYESLRNDARLTRRIEAIKTRIKPRGKRAKRECDTPIEAWAPERLRDAVKRLLNELPEAVEESIELHPLRVDGKRLRYTLELLAAGLPAGDYDALYPILEELQDRLGAVNDHLAAMERLDKLADRDRAAIERAIANERTGMEQAIAEFRPWFYETFLPAFKAVTQHEPPTAATHGPKVASA